MESIDFAFSLAMMNKLSSTLITISANLQGIKIDLIQCCREVTNLRQWLTDLQNNKVTFEQILTDAVGSMNLKSVSNSSFTIALILELCDVIGIDGIPLTRNGVTRRDYCKDIFVKYATDLEDQLADRFGPHQRLIYSLQYLIPCFFGK